MQASTKTQDHTMEEAMEKAIALNAEGVSHIKHGELKSAILSFRQGLMYLLVPNQAATQPCLEAPQQHKEMPVARTVVHAPHATRKRRMTPESNSSRPQEHKGQKDRLLSSVPLPDVLSSSSSLHDDVMLIFNRAIDMSPELVKYATGHLVSAIITYNVGLAHHVEGLRVGDSVLLGRGLDFYSIAYTSFRGQQELVDSLVHLNLALLALANNIGHIHAYFRAIEEAGICSDELCLRLSSVFPACATADPIITSEEYNVFFLNVFLFPQADVMSAPMA